MSEEVTRFLDLRSVALRSRAASRYRLSLGGSPGDEADDALIGGLVGEVDEIIKGPWSKAIDFLEIFSSFDLTPEEIALFGAGPVEDLLVSARTAEPVNALAAAARSNATLRQAIDMAWVDSDTVRPAVWEAFTAHFGERWLL